MQYEEALYAAVPARLLEVVRTLPDRNKSVMLIGHNPSLEEFTAMLCGQSAAYPTAALRNHRPFQSTHGTKSHHDAERSRRSSPQRNWKRRTEHRRGQTATDDTLRSGSLQRPQTRCGLN